MCERERERERERDGRVLHCKDSCSSRTCIFFLVHLVSSFLSPLSLFLSLSLAIPRFFSAEGGMGKGWCTGPGGEGEWGVAAVEAVAMVTMPRQIFIKSLK